MSEDDRNKWHDDIKRLRPDGDRPQRQVDRRKPDGGIAKHLVENIQRLAINWPKVKKKKH